MTTFYCVADIIWFPSRSCKPVGRLKKGRTLYKELSDEKSMKPKKDFKVAWTLIYNRACQRFIFQSLHLLMVNAEKTRKRVLTNIRDPCFATNLDSFAVGNRAKAQHFHANLKFLIKKLFSTQTWANILISIQNIFIGMHLEIQWLIIGYYFSWARDQQSQYACMPLDIGYEG